METPLILQTNNILVLSSIDSTNNYCKILIEEGRASNGLVVQSLAQTDGRGQQKNIWLSQNDKDLLLSFIFQPKANINPFGLNMAISIGVQSYVQGLLPNEIVKIKWSNDIFVGNQKIAGILIENAWRGSQINYCVAGIGLNLNSVIDKIKLPHATSLSAFTGINYNLFEQGKMLCEAINNALFWLGNTAQEQVLVKYNDLLYGINTQQEYTHLGKVFEAINNGINDAGQLKLIVNNPILLTPKVPETIEFNKQEMYLYTVDYGTVKLKL